MKKFVIIAPFLLFIASIFLVFKQWVLSSVLTGGDFWYYFPSMYKTASAFQFGWITEANNGLGGVASVYQPVHFVFALAVYLFAYFFHLPWEFVAKVGFFLPFLLFAFIIPFFLFKKIFPKLSAVFALLASFLFFFNTYMLLLAGGGQINLANACLLGLLLLYLLIRFSREKSSNVYTLLLRSVLLGVVTGLIIVWDIRFAYITLLAYILFIAISLKKENFVKSTFESFIFFLVIPSITAVALNAFWIVPVLFLHQNPLQQLGPIYSTVGAVKFFSFAKLENSIGLLHPNWPENIFGLTYFMRPEFLLLPVFAFVSLFFLKPFDALRSLREKQEQHYVLYFALLGLVGAFLAKGANDPFGGIYLWLFGHIPGFVLFRDPSKWYFLVVTSYIILIPYTLSKISGVLKEKIKLRENISSLIVLVFMLLAIFLVRPAFFGQLGRTLTFHSLPREYTDLEQFLSSDKSFGRSLWIPSLQRFGFYSPEHPAVSGEDFFQVASVSGVVSKLQDKSTENLLQNSGIKYVLVPFDSEKEIFIRDRKYNNDLYRQTVQGMSEISWLKRVPGFGRITVFEVPDAKDHFYLSKEGSITNNFINPTQYEVELKNVTQGERLIFAEGFDKYWIMEDGSEQSESLKYNNLFNSFILKKSGSYAVVVRYLPQMWVAAGLWISLFSSCFIIIFSLFLWKVGRKNLSRNSS